MRPQTNVRNLRSNSCHKRTAAPGQPAPNIGSTLIHVAALPQVLHALVGCSGSGVGGAYPPPFPEPPQHFRERCGYHSSMERQPRQRWHRYLAWTAVLVSWVVFWEVFVGPKTDLIRTSCLTKSVGTGSVFLLRRGKTCGVFQIIEQGFLGAPGHKREEVAYRWRLRTDGVGRLDENDPSVTAGEDHGSGIRFGPFEVRWSAAEFGRGYCTGRATICPHSPTTRWSRSRHSTASAGSIAATRSGDLEVRRTISRAAQLRSERGARRRATTSFFLPEPGLFAAGSQPAVTGIGLPRPRGRSATGPGNLAAPRFSSRRSGIPRACT